MTPHRWITVHEFYIDDDELDQGPFNVRECQRCGVQIDQKNRVVKCDKSSMYWPNAKFVQVEDDCDLCLIERILDV